MVKHYPLGLGRVIADLCLSLGSGSHMGDIGDCPAPGTQRFKSIRGCCRWRAVSLVRPLRILLGLDQHEDFWNARGTMFVVSTCLNCWTIVLNWHQMLLRYDLSKQLQYGGVLKFGTSESYGLSLVSNRNATGHPHKVRNATHLALLAVCICQ